MTSPPDNSKLSPQATMELFTAVLRNAEALASEARLLLDAKHTARAYALAHLAHEELAKCFGLLNVWLTQVLSADVAPWQLFWTRWRHHGFKVQLALAGDVIRKWVVQQSMGQPTPDLQQLPLDMAARSIASTQGLTQRCLSTPNSTVCARTQCMLIFAMAQLSRRPPRSPRRWLSRWSERQRSTAGSCGPSLILIRHYSLKSGSTRRWKTYRWRGGGHRKAESPVMTTDRVPSGQRRLRAPMDVREQVTTWACGRHHAVLVVV